MMTDLTVLFRYLESVMQVCIAEINVMHMCVVGVSVTCMLVRVAK